MIALIMDDIWQMIMVKWSVVANANGDDNEPDDNNRPGQLGSDCDFFSIKFHL